VAKINREELKEQTRILAENDLIAFIRLVAPGRCLGAIHEEVGYWWTRPERRKYQITLLPRDHMKSALLAFRVAQRIVKDPTVRVLYVSSTANLATKQLKFIKDILTSDIVRFYWPELINREEAKREKWTENEISVDDPRRKAEAIRDPTVFAVGLTTNVVGLHCDVCAMDDIVTLENAYTEEGRNKTRQQYSFFASIESADAEEWIVGTRYHPKDLYNDILEMRVEEHDDQGELIRDEQLFELFGDGLPEKCHVEVNGEFLWPRQQRKDGKWFGFDSRILADKKSKYLDPIQFRAQYYNDPNDLDGAGIKRENFQYYDRKYLQREGGKWYLKMKRLNVFAAIDFAYSMAKKADYTAIVVIGVDADRNYYILDIDRFKTAAIHEYFEHILRLHQKWDFRTLRAEVTAGQKPIVDSLKRDHIQKHGLALVVDEFRPSRHEGTKGERLGAILQPKYGNRQVWHYLGGHCQTLEEELVLNNPPHDDIMDALAAAVDVAKAPTFANPLTSLASLFKTYEGAHTKFGGIS
jgi:phage terminase large subunit-like protein